MSGTGKLLDSRADVRCVAFAPRHHGLRLATCGLDGRVRIYESNDVMNLSNWPLVVSHFSHSGFAFYLSLFALFRKSLLPPKRTATA